MRPFVVFACPKESRRLSGWRQSRDGLHMPKTTAGSSRTGSNDQAPPPKAEAICAFSLVHWTSLTLSSCQKENPSLSRARRLGTSHLHRENTRGNQDDAMPSFEIGNCGGISGWD